MQNLRSAWLGMALLGGLLFSAGCYRELDFSKIECDVNAKSSCPSGYQCSAGLCVKASDGADAAATEGGAPGSADLRIVDQVVGGIDVPNVETAGGTDAPPAIETAATVDTMAAPDLRVPVADAVNDRLQDMIITIDVPAEVSSTPDGMTDGVSDSLSDVLLDSASGDSRASADLADVLSSDAVIIETEIRTIESFKIPTSDVVPTEIVRGPDDNLWFAEYNTKSIGRVTLSGQIKEFPTPSGAYKLVAGEDKNLWYTSADGLSVGRFNPTTAEVVEFPVPTGSEARWITAGPDGNLWFTDTTNDQIGKMTISGSVTLYPVESTPRGIVKGMDGNLWYGGYKGIGRIGTDGRYKLFPAPPTSAQWAAEAITVGGDGRLWFTFDEPPGEVGAMTTSGDVSEYPINQTPTVLPFSHSIVGGPDGNIWFADSDGIVRITPTGKVTMFILPSEMGSADYLTVGADGYIWFTDMTANKIGHMRI
jgi:virginiamycin B lyase